jgi:hypothetical protein
MDFVKIGKSPEHIDENIKGWMRIAMALNRWREEKNREFTPEEENITFTRLIFLSAGEKLEEEFAEEEDLLLDYLEHPVGDE